MRMPPESSRGTASAESDRPTAASAASTRAAACARAIPRSASGSATLRRTVAQGMSAASWNT